MRNPALPIAYVALLPVILGGCSDSDQKAKALLPTSYGLYATDAGRLHRLEHMADGPAVSRKVEFILFDPSVSFGVKSDVLYRKDGVGWVGTKVAVHISPIAGQPQMVRIVPQQPLNMGTHQFIAMPPDGGIGWEFNVVDGEG